MNKKARLILGLIPLFILIPILFGGLIAPTDPTNPNLPNLPGQSPGMPVDDPRFIDPPPTLQFYSDTLHTNTTAVLTAIATDYLDNAGIRWIRIYEDGHEWGYKDCGGQTTCTFVKVKTETQNTTHTYYATTMDLGNHLVESQHITIIFDGLNQNPIIDNYVPQDLTPDVNENDTLHFEVWAHDPNNDPLNYTWKLDSNQVSTTTVYDYHPDFNASGYHNVYVIISDGKGGIATLTWNVTVINVLLNSTCYLNFDPQSPITYGTLLNATCSCTNPEAPAHLWRDDLNIDAENNTYVLLAAGTYNYTCNVTQTQNYRNASNSSLYTINRANHTIHLALNGLEQDLNVSLGTQTNATGWLVITQGVAGATLYRNGSVVATGSPATEIANLSAGLYNYTYDYPQSQNYTAQSITRWLNVTGKINSTCNLSFVPPSPITYDLQPFIAFCSCTNPEAPAELWRDGLNVTNEIGVPVTLAANPAGYGYVCNVTETQNYTNASNSSLYIIQQGQTILTLIALPSWNVTYPTQTNVSCSANNNQVVLTLTRNGLNVSNPDVSLLGAGLYYYNCSTPGNQNWTAASATNILNVSRAASLVNLTLNGIDDNITVNVGELVNATGWLIIPVFYLPPVNNSPIDGVGGDGEIGIDSIPHPQPQLYEIELYMDGLWVAIGNRSVSYVTNFSAPGLHNFTARYPGTQNYSQSNETHWVTVVNDTIAPVVTLIFPPNGSTTGENVTVIYNVTDNIDLLLDCDIYSNTTGNWTIDGSRQTPNGTSDSWNYTNLTDGTYIWNVECRDDANNRAFAVDNWTFIVNITGDLIPPDVWNVSATPQIVNQTESTMIEAFANDNVAVDTVLAQVTYPDNTSVNYTMAPGMIADQYLYNFTNTVQIGNHSVRIFANDTSNNLNDTETTWFVVQVAPGFGNTTTIITQPANNSVFNVSEVFITEANVTAVNGDVVDCNATITFSNNSVLNTTQPVNILGNITNGTTLVTQWNVTAIAVGISDITVTTTCMQGGSSFDIVYNITVSTGDIEPPVIIFVPPTPANNSTVNVDYVYVNTTITDNVAVDTAILDWNGTNFTMAGAEPNYYLNVTGLADGLYIYRVYANDTSNNWNVSETRYVTVNTTTPNQPPVVNLTSPLNNTIFHNQQSINFSYIATDDNDLSFLCTIFLDNIANQSQITQNNTATNFTINGIAKGTHSWRVECLDSGGMNGVSVTWFFTIGLHDVEIVLNYTNSINGIRITAMNGTDIMDDPANLSQNETYYIRYRINNNGYPEIDPEQVNVTVWLVNSTGRYLITSYLQAISQFHLGNVTFNPSAFSPGQYNITVNATIIGYADINPSDNERNRTINIIQVGDFIPPWYLNITVVPPSPQVYSPTQVYWFNITWQDNVAVAQVWFEFNGVNYTPTCVPGLPINDTLCSNNFTGLAVGNYSYRWYARDTSNNYNQTPIMQYVVTQENITGFLHLALNGSESNLTVTYPAVTNATGWSNLNVSTIIYNLYRNNTFIATGDPASDIRTLGAGVYNYVYNTTGNQNYSAGTTPVRVLTVNQGTTILTLNATPSWNVTVGTQTNVTCAANNGEVLMNLYRNSSLVTSGYNLIFDLATLPVGNYTYVCNTTGSQNWTAASVTNTLIVSPLLPGDIHLWLNGTEGNLTVTYANESLKFNASTLYGNVSIRRNGTLIAGPNASYVEVFNNLAAGVYNFTAYSTGDVNHSSASVTYFLTINQANGSITLLLNGTNGDITIIEGQSVNHTAILTAPTSGNVSLLRNSSQFAQGPSPLTSISQYNNPVTYNITAFYAGNQNYTNASATHFITVLPAIHDVSVDSIQLLKEVNGVNKTANNSNTYLYDLIYVNSNVSNVGNMNETNINVTLEDNSVVKAWQLINLNVGETKQVNFTWNATPKDWHTVKVKSLPVPGETNLANNEQSRDVRVWAVCDVIDCTIFMPLTQYDNYTLGTPFLVRAKLQNLWAAQSFQDLKVELQVSSGLTIIAPWPAIQWHNLAPGEFKYSNWNVTSTRTGNETLTTWAGNHEYSDIKYVLITP